MNKKKRLEALQKISNMYPRMSEEGRKRFEKEKADELNESIGQITKTLTNEKLNEIYKYLCAESGTSLYDVGGRPVFSLTFNGTEEQYEATKKKLIELDPKKTNKS